MRTVEKKIHDSIFNVLEPAKSAASRTSFGGTAPENVRRAIVTAKERYL